MARSTKDNTSTEMYEDKLKYLGLDLSNLPKKVFENKKINFKPLRSYEDNNYKVYKYIDVEDIDILNSIENHIMGAPDMSLLEKIIYVGDLIEMGRNEKEIPILKPLRDLALNGKLDEAVALESKHVLSHLVNCNIPVSPNSLATYNYYVKYLKGVKF